MRNILVAVFLVTVSVVDAQNNDDDSVKYTPIDKPEGKEIKINKNESSKAIGYFFNIQMGSLIGCKDCGKSKDLTFSGSTVHGVTIGNKFRGGVGLGFDSYINWQTLPVYAMMSWDLIGSKNKNALCFQLDYGWAHPWFMKNGQYQSYSTDPFSAVSGGRMINPSLGYRLKYHDLKLALSVGYKYQRIFYKSSPYYYGCPACDYYRLPSQSLDITEDLNRVQIMMSVGWR